MDGVWRPRGRSGVAGVGAATFTGGRGATV